MTLADSKAAVLQKFASQPYRYFGPFENQKEAQEYIEANEMQMAFVIELRKP